MKNALILTALLAIVALCSVPIFGETLEPLTVSPGAIDRFTGVEVRCPTFSWQAVPGTVRYEVVVYELPPEVDLAGWSLDEAVEVLFVELPSGVTGWTPSLERGLARGMDHVWFVRGVFGDGSATATSWSQARFFRVVGGTLEPGIGVQSREVGESSGAGAGEGGGEDAARSRGTKGEHRRSAMEKRVGEKNTKDVGTAMAAIRGEMPDVTGETYGVVGTSNSPDGAGIGAANTAGGPDLVLDGAEDGETDLDFYQSGIDRSSTLAEKFDIGNTGGGGMTLSVDGFEVVTVLSDQDTLGGLSCGNWEVAKWDGSQWACERDSDILVSLACASGEIAKWNGSIWNCAPDIDTNTTYSAGAGLHLSGTEFRSRGSGYEHMVVVATDGGDFDNIQDAIDNIAGASASHPFLVWVGPGVFTGPVTLKAHVHLQGAGRGATVITAALGASFFPPDAATLVLASDSSVRDLAVENHATTGSYGIAILAPAGTSNAEIGGLAASSLGTGVDNTAGFVSGAGTEVRVEDSVFTAENGTTNTGFHARDEASMILRDVTVVARGGGVANGVIGRGPVTILKAHDLQATAENGSSFVYGLDLRDGITTTLVGGMIVASGSSQGRGIYNAGVDTRLEATGITVVAEDGTTSSNAIFNYDSASAILVGGSYSALRGGGARGIYNYGSDTSIETYNVKCLARDASSNAAFSNYLSTSARLHGGSFDGRGGANSYGINNLGSGAMMYAWDVDALAEDGSDSNYGMQSYQEAVVVLYGGSFTALGGNNSYGIYGSGAATKLEVSGVTALSEGGVTVSSALYCRTGATVEVHGGWFTGVGGVVAAGIQIRDSATTLDATGIVVSGSGGSSSSYGLHQQNGSSRLAISQFENGIAKIAGTMTCFQNYDGSFASYSCP